MRAILETIAIVIATNAVLTALWLRWPGATYGGALLLLVGLLALLWRSGRGKGA